MKTSLLSGCGSLRFRLGSPNREPPKMIYLIPKSYALLSCYHGLHSSGKFSARFSSFRIFLKEYSSFLQYLLLILRHKAWLTFSLPTYHKGVKWGWCQGSEQADQVLPHLTGEILSLLSRLCNLYWDTFCHGEIEKGFTTKLEAPHFMSYHCML